MPFLEDLSIPLGNLSASIITIEIPFNFQEIRKDRREEQTKQLACQLQAYLGTVRFYEIKNNLEEVLETGKITVSFIIELRDWFNRTANSLTGALSELKHYYYTQIPNNSRLKQYKYAHLPKSSEDIERVQKLFEEKGEIREQIEEYIKNPYNYLGELSQKEIEDIKLLLRQINEMNEKVYRLHNTLNEFLQ